MGNEWKRELTKKLGFGCMRLPVQNGDSAQIDDAQFCKMIDAFLEQGFAYFDTAYPYHNEKSEEAVRRCLVERHDRSAFYLADKMPVWLVQKEEDYERIFNMQLARCGVEYFDFYLLHAMNRERAKEAEKLGGFAFLARKKAEGKIRHIGFSFHDSADALEEILNRHPEVEFVQLQINYYDWDSESVQSRKCYETAVRHGKAVIVMEPVKGGTLANLVKSPAQVLRKLDKNASFASYAVRFAASLDGVVMVLSGMSDWAQLCDNTSYMKDFRPLSAEERRAVEQVVEELEKMLTIPCTKCRYCVEGCPKKIQIPDLFETYNLTVQFGMTDNYKKRYINQTGEGHGSADACIRCGACEKQCPQHLQVRELLAQVAQAFA